MTETTSTSGSPLSPGQAVAGSTALVTGASRGLGSAFVAALLERGATRVYAAARNPDDVRARFGDDARVVALQLDVTDARSVRAAATVATDVDLLVNNAGIGDGGSVFGPDGIDTLRRQLETNTLGPLLVTRDFAPTLEANGGGTVVNVLSVLSWVTMAPTSAYSASKAAAWSLTNATRGELAAQGTRVVGVHVGYLDTDMAAHVDGPKTDPAALAAQVLDAVEAGADEVLGDDLSRGVKSGLSGPVRQLSA
jgi:NAD(P)-dependent dehydrogenase (short-subunit alcohol dehydrogenase family)